MANYHPLRKENTGIADQGNLWFLSSFLPPGPIGNMLKGDVCSTALYSAPTGLQSTPSFLAPLPQLPKARTSGSGREQFLALCNLSLDKLL